MIEQISIVKQKITIPKDFKYMIIRDDIHNRIEESDENVFLFFGKSGYGKTAAVAGYCKEKTNIIWYTLDKEDNKEEVFLYHFIYAMEKYGKKWKDWKDKFQKLTKNNVDRIIQNLSELSEEENLFIVFDGLQWIRNSNVLHFLKKIMEYASPQMKIFIITQSKIQDCFSKYISKGNYVRFSEKDLTFTDGEIEKLIKTHYNIGKVKKEYVKQIKEITLGWPVAVFFVLTMLKTQEKGIEKILKITRKKILTETELFGYISYEIFDRLSLECQEFLIKTAPLEELEEELCDICLSKNNSKNILHNLLEKEIIQVYSIKDEYRFICFPIIKEYLLEKVDESWQKKVKKNAGAYYIGKKNYDKAFDYIKDDVNQLSDLLEQCGKEMLQEEQFSLLDNCISYLQKSEREFSVLQLEILAEYYYRTGDLEQMEKCLNKADSMFGKENKYGIYRSLYRGLFRYHENPGKYEKQVNNVLFFLKENHIVLPYLKTAEQETLQKIIAGKESKKKKEEKRISITAFGTFKVHVTEDGKELTWRTKKGCEVFAYLLDRNGEAVERKTLLQELWNNEIPNNAVALLHNMFYNIRKELSYYNLEHIIQYREKKYTMNMGMIQSDLALIGQIASYVESKNMNKLREHSKIMVKYWGRYLENIDNFWVQEKQEYYEKIYEKGCFILGCDCMEQEKYEEALIYLKNALTINIYSEKIMGRILECYSKLGDLKGVKRQYEVFSSFLKKELDLEPGEKLKDIYKQCMDWR